MTNLFKAMSMLLASAFFAFILSCEIISIEKNSKKETALLLDFINYSGQITYYVGEDKQSYSMYASGFYSDLLSETWITASSDTIVNRHIQIVLVNIKAEGTYTSSTDDVIIELLDGNTNTWSSFRPGGSAIIEITKYGDVGDTIEGTFSGTLRYSCNCSFMHIKNGKFSVRRTSDQ